MREEAMREEAMKPDWGGGYEGGGNEARLGRRLWSQTGRRL